jgi:ferritin
VGEHVVLDAIKKPETKFKSLTDMFARTLKHEKLVTSLINNLADLAVKQKDHATEIFLQWFVTEQIEEEENANDILARLRLAGEDGSGLFMIDNELAARMFTMPPDMVKAGA